MTKLAIKAENISKQYRLGEVGTGTLSHDLNRMWYKMRGKKDPYLKIGESNDRSKKGESDYVWSLRDINFEIKQGDAVGIIGKNGAGKSTLLKILSKVTKPTTGNIKVNGRIASLLEVGTGFNPEMTGRENIYLNGAILGMRKAEITRKLDEIVDFSGVERYLDTPVKRYSSGMYVRLAFAVAAHLESEILIVDEVLAVGDAEFQKKCLGKMGDISKGEGRTVLFVSHNMAAVKQLCNNGLLLENGKVSFSGNISEVISNYYTINYYRTENLPSGKYSFIDHCDKKNAKFGLLTAELYCNDKLDNIIFTGGKFELRLQFHASRDFSEAEIGIVIKDSNEVSYLGLNNKHLGEILSIKKGIGSAVIVIEDFPLFANDYYWINLYFGDIGANYECLENAIRFRLIGEDAFKSGKLLDYNWNKIIHKKTYIKTL